MNKKVIIGGISFVALIVLVFFLGIRLSSGTHTVTKSIAEFTSENSKPQKCILQNNATYRGELYTNNGQVRLDIRQGSQAIHFVFARSVATQWSDDKNEGARMSMSEVTAFDVNAKYSFLCSSWTVDPSVFTPPVQKIYFASTKQKNDDATLNTQESCKVCDGLESAALETCKKQLNCP